MLQQLAYGALVTHFDPEALGDHTLKIDAPPAHHAIDGAIRAGLDDLGQFPLVEVADNRRGFSRAKSSFSPSGPRALKPVNPILQRLPIHAAGVFTAPSLHILSSAAAIGQLQRRTALVRMPR